MIKRVETERKRQPVTLEFSPDAIDILATVLWRLGWSDMPLEAKKQLEERGYDVCDWNRVTGEFQVSTGAVHTKKG